MAGCRKNPGTMDAAIRQAYPCVSQHDEIRPARQTSGETSVGGPQGRWQNLAQCRIEDNLICARSSAGRAGARRKHRFRPASAFKLCLKAGISPGQGEMSVGGSQEPLV